MNVETRIEEREGRGRCCIAATRSTIDAGTLLLRAEPVAAVLRGAAARSGRCHRCWRAADEAGVPALSRCSGCRHAWYCSTKCQQQDWLAGEHKTECAALKALLPRTPPETVLLASRVLRLRTQQQQQQQPQQAWDAVAALRPAPDFGTAAASERTGQKYMAMAVMLRDFIGMDALRQLVPTAESLVRLLSVLETNAFNISDANMRPIGVGLYPHAALFNHSCNPNAATVFEGKTAFVRAIRAIAPGEEITVGYVDLGQPVGLRRKELLECFGFECKCERCTEESRPRNPLTRMATGLRCTSQTCKGCVDSNTWICDACNARISEDDASAIRDELSKAAEARSVADEKMKTGLFAEARENLESVLAVETRLLYPQHYSLMMTHSALLNCCIELHDWKSAVRHCKATIPLFERAYPPNWPVVGLQYFMLGKLQWHLGHTERALLWLRKTKLVLGISHNFDNTVFRQLSELVHQVEVEYAARPQPAK